MAKPREHPAPISHAISGPGDCSLVPACPLCPQASAQRAPVSQQSGKPLCSCRHLLGGLRKRLCLSGVRGDHGSQAVVSACFGVSGLGGGEGQAGEGTEASRRELAAMRSGRRGCSEPPSPPLAEQRGFLEQLVPGVTPGMALESPGFRALGPCGTERPQLWSAAS